MVHFKMEFSFSLFGKRNKRESVVDNKVKKDEAAETKAWDLIAKTADDAKVQGCYKTAYNYLTAARSFTRFMQRDDWTFAEVTSDETERYQRWLTQQGVCMNTVSCYMRSLRTIYNKVVENGLAEDRRPFRRVFTGKEQTRKRTAVEVDLQQLAALPLAADSALAFARDLFLFGFFAMGMPFVDMAFLRKSQLKDGKFRYARHKTGQEIEVAIEPCMMEIIDRYKDKSTGYVFPIITEKDAAGMHRQYESQLRLYNMRLARLSNLIGASIPLTSYVVRHTWASMAYKYQMDIGLISKALGHTKTSTTMVYIKHLFDPQLATANHRLLEEIKAEKQ